jgi:hypothetical protein
MSEEDAQVCNLPRSRTNSHTAVQRSTAQCSAAQCIVVVVL